jgi:hypothetical protein
MVNYKPSIEVHTYNLSYPGGGSRKIINSRPPWAKITRPYLETKQNTKQTKGLGCGSSGEALSLASSSSKKKKCYLKKKVI